LSPAPEARPGIKGVVPFFQTCSFLRRNGTVSPVERLFKALHRWYSFGDATRTEAKPTGEAHTKRRDVPQSGINDSSGATLGVVFVQGHHARPLPKRCELARREREAARGAVGRRSPGHEGRGSASRVLSLQNVLSKLSRRPPNRKRNARVRQPSRICSEVVAGFADRLPRFLLDCTSRPRAARDLRGRLRPP